MELGGFMALISRDVLFIAFPREKKKKERTSTQKCQAFPENACLTESADISGIIVSGVTTWTDAEQTEGNYRVFFWIRQYRFGKDLKELPGSICSSPEGRTETHQQLQGGGSLLALLSESAFESHFTNQGCWPRSLSRPSARPTSAQQQLKGSTFTANSCGWKIVTDVFFHRI